MPELPEVETTRSDLSSKIIGAEILDLVSDCKKSFIVPDFTMQREMLVGKKIMDVCRRAKHLYFTLSDGMNLVFHLRMTGHLMLVKDTDLDGFKWKEPIKSKLLADPQNRFLHHLFYLDDGRVLAMSDLRKFATINLMDKNRLEHHLCDLGPEPMEDDFTEDVFMKIMKRSRGPIKKILLDQTKIAGIGNIYADEILFDCRMNPTALVEKLNDAELRELYISTLKILKEAIRLRGTSISDFRDIEGRMGSYQDVRRVYKRKDEPCVRCGNPITRIVVAQRGTHYCSVCQPPRK